MQLCVRIDLMPEFTRLYPISMRRENQSKNTVSVFSRHTKERLVKKRTLYISSKWIDLVFIIEDKYDESETLIVQSLVKVNLIQ